MIKGIDISRHQGKVDFDRVAEQGFKFCFVKCTEGQGYVDPMFLHNWEKLVGMQEKGMYRGAYHFARPGSDGSVEDAKREAGDFCDALLAVGSHCRGCLPPVLDFEQYSDNGPHENERWIRAFSIVVEERLDRKPIIYTGKNIWRHELGNTGNFSDHLLWLVKYTMQGSLIKSHGDQHKPLPWDKWTFWQWSGGGDFNFHGPVLGVDGDCDVNYFSGAQQELAKLALDSPPS